MNCKCIEICYIEGPKCFAFKPINCSKCGEEFCVEKDLPADEYLELCPRCEYEISYPVKKE